MGTLSRKEANLKIAEIIKGLHIDNLQFELINGSVTLLSNLFKILTEEYPHQRAGQIFCNYICPDYRDKEVSVKTKLIMQTLFPKDPDPFFEESVVTLERLKSYFKSK